MRRAVAAGALALLTLPGAFAANAGEFYLVHGYGKSPERHLFFAAEKHASPPPGESLAIANSVQMKSTFGKLSVNEDEIRKKTEALKANYRGANVIEVFESKDAPDNVNYDLQFRCDSGLARFTRTFKSYRENERTEALGEQAWMPLSAHPKWVARVHEFACDPAARTEDNRMVPVGEYSLGMLVVNMTWKTYWTDGKRPAFTTNKTKEQLAADRERMMAEIQASASKLQAMAGTARQDYEEDQERFGEEQEHMRVNAKRRGVAALHVNALETWIDANEDDLVRSFGNPESFTEDKKGRYLTYRVGNYSTNTVTSGPGAGATVAGGDWTCVVRLQFKRGELYTYWLDGHKPSCWEHKFPIGPFPAKGGF